MHYLHKVHSNFELSFRSFPRQPLLAPTLLMPLLNGCILIPNSEFSLLFLPKSSFKHLILSASLSDVQCSHSTTPCALPTHADFLSGISYATPLTVFLYATTPHARTAIQPIPSAHAVARTGRAAVHPYPLARSGHSAGACLSRTPWHRALARPLQTQPRRRMVECRR